MSLIAGINRGGCRPAATTCLTVQGVLLGALLISPPPARAEAPALAPASMWEMVWADEFDGEALDPAKWNVVTGGGGYGNNERQYYSDNPDNLALRDGCLVITARQEARDGNPYTSGKITSQGKAAWTYGRFDIRARLPRGQGIWPAIWMMPADRQRYGGWPQCGEIDIMELVGHAPATVYGTLHYGNPWHNSGRAFSLPGGPTFADDFHQFSLTWAPGQFDWYVDGRHFHSETNWYSSASGARWPAPFDRAFFLQLNVAVGGNWPGYPNATTRFPQEMAVDYVRVYRYRGDYPPVEDRSARPAFLEPREPLADGNLVYNGDFAQGTQFWEIGRYEGGDGEFEAGDGALRIEVTRPGSQPWSIQVIQRPLTIRRGQAYRVWFRARSDRPRTLEVNVGKASQPWDSYSGKRTLELNTGFKEYAVTFTMDHPTDPVARLEFNAGHQPGPVWLDDVSLRPDGVGDLH